MLRLLSALLVGMLLSACVSDRAFQAGQAQTKSAPVDLADDGKYVLAHVEFDDQGWFHDIRQRQALFDRLQALKAANQAMLIVTYTHGWKHNASESNGNLAEFRKLLSQLHKVEAAAKREKGPRTVVGVYIGWRGASLSLPFLDNITFWTRKNAAERVGTRSVKQLFIELNQFRMLANGWDTPDQLAESDETQLIFVGHSFGGLVTYHALYSEILERGLQVNAKGNYRVAKSFGDFVLLVNPAFEGSAYEPIWQAAQLRACYPTWQKPVMAIVTSSADWATRYAFPAGRLYTLAQSASLPGERETVMHTVGHLERYRTHRLVTGPPAADEPPALAEDAAQGRASAQPNARAVTRIGDFRLIKTENAAPARMPYLVIQAGPELIADHNDFWNDRFRAFTVGFIANQILSQQGWTARGAERAAPAGEACAAFRSGAATVSPAAPHTQ